MAEVPTRHFQRLLPPRAVRARVRWPVAPKESFPQTLEAVYDGDTVHVFARFPEPPTGVATLEITLADGRVLTQPAVLRPAPATEAAEVPSTVARLAARQALKGTDDAVQGAALAVRYQLISPWTSYIVVAERAEAEKATELPALRQVPHLLAAGWGGTGSVQASLGEYADVPAFLRRQTFGPERAAMDSSIPVPCPAMEVTEALRPAPPPTTRPRSLRDLFRRRKATAIAATTGPLSVLVDALNGLFSEGPGGTLTLSTLADLAALGADEVMVEALARLVASGYDERAVVIAFLQALAEGPAGGALVRHARRVIRMGYKQLGLDEAGREALREALDREPALHTFLAMA